MNKGGCVMFYKHYENLIEVTTEMEGNEFTFIQSYSRHSSMHDRIQGRWIT
jgi:hypothetical protein